MDNINYNPNKEIIFKSDNTFIHKIITNNNKESKSQYQFSYSNYYIDLFKIYKIPFNIKNKEFIDKEILNEENIESVIIIDDINYEITTFENFIKYNQYDMFQIDNDVILKIIYDIGFIIKLLERENKSIFSISINDIIVVNNNTFLFINKSKILNINKKYINYYNSLTNEEILKLPLSILKITENNELSIKVYYTNVYYSFGILLLDLLYWHKRENYITNSNCYIILKLFKKYKYCGIYYFIKRCIDEDINKRTLLFL
jgi:hypothetical protein